MLQVLFRTSVKWKVALKVLYLFLKILNEPAFEIPRELLIDALKQEAHLEIQDKSKTLCKLSHLDSLILPYACHLFQYLRIFSICVKQVPHFYMIKKPQHSKRSAHSAARPKVKGERGALLQETNLQLASHLLKAFHLFNKVRSASLDRLSYS